MSCKKDSECDTGGEKYCQMYDNMGKFAPKTLKAIKDLNPGFIELIHNMDQTIIEDGALDRKTKRLIALACVCVRSCEDCVYPQAKVAKTFGATREEILEAVNVAVLTGGVPSWSTAKKGITQLFEEWDKE
ncbi:MAG: carboxymuconolactone decarboxylase family protein [Candidatus Methanomethylophilaceae archaeon]|jgi:AhpD family alkylhydroperoxidase